LLTFFYQHVPRLTAIVFNDEQTKGKSFVLKKKCWEATRCIGRFNVMFLVSHKYDSLILQGSGFGANKAFRFYSMAVVNGK